MTDEKLSSYVYLCLLGLMLVLGVMIGEVYKPLNLKQSEEEITFPFYQHPDSLWGHLDIMFYESLNKQIQYQDSVITEIENLCDDWRVHNGYKSQRSER